MRCFVPASALLLALLVGACTEPAAPPPTTTMPAPTPPTLDEAPVAEKPAEKPTEQPTPKLADAQGLAPVTPPAANGKSGDVLKTVRFPGGELALPSAWMPKVRSEPPMTAVHVIPAPAMTCDLALLEGHGTQRQAEEYLAAGANAYNGETARAPVIDVGGLAFQGILIKRPKALPDNGAALVEVYAAIAGGDLVGIGVTRLEPGPALDEGRRLCLQAFAQLTSKLSSLSSSSSSKPAAP